MRLTQIGVAGLLVAPGGQVRRHPEGEGPKETAANARQPVEPERTDAAVPDRKFQSVLHPMSFSFVRSAASSAGCAETLSCVWL